MGSWSHTTIKTQNSSISQNAPLLCRGSLSLLLRTDSHWSGHHPCSFAFPGCHINGILQILLCWVWLISLNKCNWDSSHCCILHYCLFYSWVVVFVLWFQYLIVSGFASDDYLLRIFSFMYPLHMILYVSFPGTFYKFVLDHEYFEYYAVRLWVLLKSPGQRWLDLVNVRWKALLQSVGCGSTVSQFSFQT